MLNKSRRAKRMERHHARRKQPAMNLVSLMDVFTILVFFLLFSSSTVHQLPKKKDIQLPTSIATKAPTETLVIFVTQKSILVQGREVATIDKIMQEGSPLIGGLLQELIFQSSKSQAIKNPDGKIQGRAATIMGDENISYALLRKILATSREANYTRIAFAAIQKAPSGENN